MTSARACTFFILFTISIPTHSALGQDAAGWPRVRGVDAPTATMIRDLTTRSATGRDLIDELERSDLVV